VQSTGMAFRRTAEDEASHASRHKRVGSRTTSHLYIRRKFG
jgi:hypothetical protein